MGRTLVYVCAVIFFLYGLVFLFFPVPALQLVVQGEIGSSSGVTDIRATYGGMSIAIGIMLYKMAANSETLRLGLWSVLILMGCMAGARLLGMVIDGGPNIMMFCYLALEILACILAVLRLQNLSNRAIDV